MSFLSTVLIICKKDFITYWRKPTSIFTSIAFFFLSGFLFSISLQGSSKHTVPIPSYIVIIWICILFSNMLSLHTMFKKEILNGSLPYWFLSKIPVFIIVTIKILSDWFIKCFPIILCVPILMIMLSLPLQKLPLLLFIVGLGSLLFSFIGAMGASLTLTLQNNSTLLSILIMPFYVPVLILGISATLNLLQDASYLGHILWLLALTTFTITFAPIIISLALKIMLNEPFDH